MLDDIVRDQLRSEILQIEDLFVEFSELLDKSAGTEPSTWLREPHWDRCFIRSIPA